MKRCTVANCTKCPPDRNDHTAVNSPQLRNGTSPHGTQLGSVQHHALPSSSVGSAVGPAGHIGHHPIGSSIIGGSMSHPLHGPSGPSSGPTHGPSHVPQHGLPHVPPHGQSHLPHQRVRQSPTGLPSGLPPHSIHHQSLSNPNRQNDTSFKPVK